MKFSLPGKPKPTPVGITFESMVKPWLLQQEQWRLEDEKASTATATPIAVKQKISVSRRIAKVTGITKIKGVGTRLLRQVRVTHASPAPSTPVPIPAITASPPRLVLSMPPACLDIAEEHATPAAATISAVPAAETSTATVSAHVSVSETCLAYPVAVACIGQTQAILTVTPISLDVNAHPGPALTEPEPTFLALPPSPTTTSTDIDIAKDTTSTTVTVFAVDAASGSLTSTSSLVDTTEQRSTSPISVTSAAHAQAATSTDIDSDFAEYPTSTTDAIFMVEASGSLTSTPSVVNITEQRSVSPVSVASAAHTQAALSATPACLGDVPVSTMTEGAFASSAPPALSDNPSYLDVVQAHSMSTTAAIAAVSDSSPFDLTSACPLSPAPATCVTLPQAASSAPLTHLKTDAFPMSTTMDLKTASVDSALVASRPQADDLGFTERAVPSTMDPDYLSPPVSGIGHINPIMVSPALAASLGSVGGSEGHHNSGLQGQGSVVEIGGCLMNSDIAVMAIKALQLGCAGLDIQDGTGHMGYSSDLQGLPLLQDDNSNTAGPSMLHTTLEDRRLGDQSSLHTRSCDEAPDETLDAMSSGENGFEMPSPPQPNLQPTACSSSGSHGPNSTQPEDSEPPASLDPTGHDAETAPGDGRRTRKRTHTRKTQKSQESEASQRNSRTARPRIAANSPLLERALGRPLVLTASAPPEQTPEPTQPEAQPPPSVVAARASSVTGNAC